MVRTISNLLLTVLLIGTASVARSQAIRNLTASFRNDTVTVTYDLVLSNPRQQAGLKLYSSADNFTTPLREVSGDVGNVAPGTGKKIIWIASKELGNFDGDLSFKVRGSLLPLPLLVTGPSAGQKWKTGKTINMSWEGASAVPRVKIEVVQDSLVRLQMDSVTNNGSYNWTIPKRFKKGTYMLRVTAGEERSTGEPIQISKKFPVWLVAIPAGVAGVLLGLSGGSSSSALPLPPEPN